LETLFQISLLFGFMRNINRSKYDLMNIKK